MNPTHTIPVTDTDTPASAPPVGHQSRPVTPTTLVHRFIPPPSDVLSGARGTLLLLRLRARTTRSVKARILLWVGAAITYLMFLFMVNAGTTMRILAEREAGTPEGEFATTFVLALRSGDLGWVGALALGSVLVVTMLGPITGSANQALAPANDLTGLRMARLHRYFDTWVTTVISPTGIMQFLTLTALASLLTLDGGRTWALLLTWVTWPALLAVMIAAGWGFEWLYRATGARTKTIVTCALLSVLGVALLVDPDHGKTLFGLGEFYATAVHTATQGPSQVLTGVSVTAGIGLLAFVAGLVACREALSLPEVPHRATTTIRSFPVPRVKFLAVLTILAAVVTRTREIRRPVMVVLIMGIPGAGIAAFTGNLPENTLPALLLIVPLSVTLGFGVNVFGLLGPSVPFLLSTPGFTRHVIPAAFVMNLVVIVGMFLVISTPILILTPTRAGAFLLAVTVTSVLATVFGLRKSVTNPVRTRLTGRGDPTLPPVTAVNYTIRLLAGASVVGIIVMSAPAPYSWLAAMTALTWSTYRYVRVTTMWANPATQSRVVAEVAPG